jgi:proteic killer suppression protein
MQMKVNFGDEDLALVETDQAHELKLPIAAIKSARRKLTVIRSAPDERTLRNWKSLHFEKLQGKRDGEFSIRLNDQWRMVFHLHKDREPHEIEVTAIEDYH